MYLLFLSIISYLTDLFGSLRKKLLKKRESDIAETCDERVI